MVSFYTTDFEPALQSHQRALAISTRLFDEGHASAAYRHFSLGVAQHKLGDFKSALQSEQHALAICTKLFGDDHASGADSYCEIGITQYELQPKTKVLGSTCFCHPYPLIPPLSKLLLVKLYFV